MRLFLLVWGALLVLAGLFFLLDFIVEDAHPGPLFVAGLVFLLALVYTAISCHVVVPAGHVGVFSKFGKVYPDTLKSGFHWVDPRSSVHEMSTQTKTYTMSHKHQEGDVEGDDSLVVLTSDSLQINMDGTVPYRLVPESAAWVYNEFGDDYENRVIRKAISAAVQDAPSHFKAVEVYTTKRREMAEQMRKLIEEEVNTIISKEYKNAPTNVFVFPSLLVQHIELPEKVRVAIEQKQQMDFAIEREIKVAKQREIEATGIKAFQDIVSKGVTPDLLKWKRIEADLKLAESPNSKVIIISGDGSGEKLPLILNDSK